MKNLKLVLLAVLAFASGSVDCGEKSPKSPLFPKCRIVELKDHVIIVNGRAILIEDWRRLPIRETVCIDYERRPLDYASFIA